ncbi:MAG TPA: nuclear transport factor 2 family protein [Elusimicrobia bacterium]|jgi:ketosteroid isomerase-like protein|nr:nuclear transport factor 2 family protein [Elusimicrobiota bacterium]
MTTKEIVDKYFECVNKGDWDGWLELFDDKVVMDEQMLGHIEGRKDLAKGIEGLRSNKDFHNYPQEIVIEGERAVVICHLTTPFHNNKIDIRVANFYKIKNGKIVYFANFHDTAPFKG